MPSYTDLIIYDIEMPVADGYTVFKNILSDQKTSDIPFIFLTAYGSSQEMREGMNIGADDYIGKPFVHSNS